MAQWSDPRVTGTQSSLEGVGYGAGAVAVDAGLRAHMLKVYNYMASGVLLTGIVAMLFAQTEMAIQVMNGSALFWVLVFSPFVVVMAMSFGANRLSKTALQGLFWLLSVLYGLLFSTIFLRFTGESIAQTFFATSAAFLALSLWGYTTKKNLSGWGNFLFIGLVGLIVATVANFWLKSPTMHWVISSVGVLIFAGLTAYDTQKIKSIYFQVQGSDFVGKAAILGALDLYLDFIVMFQYLLNFMGSRD
jgi:uncharacterized protein